MHLDDGHGYARDRVADGITVMGERARVQNHAVRIRRVQFCADLALYVALIKLTFRAARVYVRSNLRVDIVQRFRAVHALFAAPRQIEIDSVEK